MGLLPEMREENEKPETKITRGFCFRSSFPVTLFSRLYPQILAGLGRIRHRALTGELDRRIDLFARLFDDPLKFVAFDQTGFQHLLLQRDNRASRLPTRHLLLGAITAGNEGLLANHVAFPSVGLA